MKMKVTKKKPYKMNFRFKDFMITEISSFKDFV